MESLLEIHFDLRVANVAVFCCIKSQLKLRFIQPVFGACHLTREFVLYLVVFKIWITDRTLKLLGRTNVRQS